MMTFAEFGFLLSWAILPFALLLYQIKSTRTFLGMRTLLACCMIAVYFSQGGIAGALVSVAAAAALFAQFAMGHELGLRARLGIAAPAIGFAIVLKEPGMAALLPLVAFSIARIAEAIRHDLGLRLAMLFCTSLWIPYAWALDLPQVMIYESLSLLSNIIAIWRIYGRKRRSPAGASG